MAGGKGSPHKTRLAQRRELALTLRKAGASYRAIAQAIREQAPDLVAGGYSPSAAYRDVMQALAEVRKRTQESAQDILAIELMRLDDLFAQAWQKAMEGDLLAIDRALRAMERRHALLGLNAPSKSEIGLMEPLRVDFTLSVIGSDGERTEY